MARTRTRRGCGEEGGAVGLLAKFSGVYNNGELMEKAPVMSYRGRDGWEVHPTG